MRVGNRWLIGALTLLCLAGVSGKAAAQNHPLHHLHHALWELRDARLELRESRWKFGEHKAKAERAIDDAIRQIDFILANVGDFARGVPKRIDFRAEYRRYPHHPHMHHAVVELRLAHAELRGARPTFAGHKEAALRDIDIAINQLDAALRFAKR